MALFQTFQQKQLQKLSPQQIQLMKLLQIPTAQLEERIKEELEENPALEQNDDNFNEETEVEEELINNDDEYELDGSEDEYDNIDISEYVSESDDETGDYRLRDENYPEINDSRVIPHKVETSFNESMIQQLGLLKLDDTEQKIAEQIVGSLDDDGYLRREIHSIIDDLAFRQNIEANEKQVLQIIEMIQQFEPAGVGARNLQECLLLQLKRKADNGEDMLLAKKVIEKYFDEFTKKHYDKIEKALNLTDDALKLIIQQIIKLNPKPGEYFGDNLINPENYITPDFFILNNNGLLELSLNSKNAPDLRISDGYRDMLKEYEKGSKKDKRQKEAVVFIKQKLDSAKWFIDAIKQRQETLLNSMEAIMKYQHQFFLTGDETELRPMILRDIAEKTSLDISTISRVANSKYVQTEFGTYKLKFFFSESLQTETGEEVSTREVKKILSDIIQEENKKNPLSDERLTEILQEKGYNIARRTVAKYREQLNVPVARLRKDF